jgi:hypothetical protein
MSLLYKYVYGLQQFFTLNGRFKLLIKSVSLLRCFCYMFWFIHSFDMSLNIKLNSMSIHYTVTFAFLFMLYHACLSVDLASKSPFSDALIYMLCCINCSIHFCTAV